MNTRWFCTLVVAVCSQAASAHGQVTRGQPWSSHLVVPQARVYAPAHAPALEITGVTAGVVIRERLATTMMEIHLRNPSSTRQEAELLVPVPEGAVVRGFAFQGRGAEPSARLLSRDEGRRDLRSHRRPGARPGPARVCRVQPGALQLSFRSSREGNRQSG